MRLRSLLLLTSVLCRPVRSFLKAAALGYLPLLAAGTQVPAEVRHVCRSVCTPFLLLIASEQFLQRVFPDQWRSLRVWSRILPLFAAYMWTRQVTQVEDGQSMDTVQKVWDARHEWGGKKVQELVSTMNGFYVKSAQVLATKAEIIPPQWCSRLSRQWDNMAPRPWKQVSHAVQSNIHSSQVNHLLYPTSSSDSLPMSKCEHTSSEWRAAASDLTAAQRPTPRSPRLELRDVFESVEPVALAAASIAQVHAATLSDRVFDALVAVAGWRNGKDVVLKVQHPDVKALMVTDLRNMGRVAAFLNPVLPFDARPMVKQMQKVVPLEFNFAREARLMARVKARLDAAGLTHPLVIPDAIPSLSTAQMVVMQRVRGTPLTRILEAGPEQDQQLWGHAKAAMVHLLHAYGRMIFVDGMFHADPHPGNLMLQDDGQLVLLDFGQCQALQLHQQKALCQLIIGLHDQQPLAMLAAVSTYGLRFGTSCLSNGLNLTAIHKMLLIMFDTRFVPEGMQSPFGKAAVVEGAPVEELPGELYLLCRMVLVLRGVFFQLGVDISSADVWYTYALEALANPERMCKRSEENKEFVVE